MNVKVKQVVETPSGHEVHLTIEEPFGGTTMSAEAAVFVPCGKRKHGRPEGRTKPEGWEPRAGSNNARVLQAFQVLGVHGGTVSTEVWRDAVVERLNAWCREGGLRTLDKWGHVPQGGRAEEWSRDYVQFCISDLVGGGKLEPVSQRGGEWSYRVVLVRRGAEDQAPLF